MGTATGTASRAWLTLDDGELTEVYAPDLGTPSIRDLQFVVTDGTSFAEREREDATHTDHARRPAQPHLPPGQHGPLRALADHQDLRDRPGPRGGAGGRPLRVAHRAALQALRAARPRAVEHRRRRRRRDRTGARWSRATRSSPRRWRPSPPRRACRAATWERATAGRTCATTSGWTGPTPARRPRATSPRSRSCRVTGKRGHRHATLALGFGAIGARPPRARPAPRWPAASTAPPTATPRAGTRTSAGSTRPRSAAGHRTLYDVSAMVLAGLEDKTYRGAGIASPSMAWVWGMLPGYSGPYHLVWSRDLYQVATAQIAAGDRAAAGARARLPVDAPAEGRRLLPAEQQPRRLAALGWPAARRGRRPDPARLAARALRRGDLEPRQARRRLHPQRGPDVAGAVGERRWTGTRRRRSPPRSPRSCAPPRSRSATARAPPRPSYRAMADDWQRKVEGWTRTTQRPALLPALLPPAHDRRQGRRGHDLHDQRRRPHDRPAARRRPSFLELVRLGVKPADDRDIRSTLPVVDRELGVTTPSGQFWHRYNYDGYGETPDGGPFPGPGNRGRLWPLLAGERGEYELAAGELSGDAAGARRAATARLDAIAATASEGWMLPEQVWDDAAARGPPGLRARHGHAVGDAAGLDARAVHAPRLVDRRRAPGRAPGRRRLPLRAGAAGRSATGAGRLAALLEVALVVVLGRPERRRGGDLGDDRGGAGRAARAPPSSSSAACWASRERIAAASCAGERRRRSPSGTASRCRSPGGCASSGRGRPRSARAARRRRRRRGRRSPRPPRRGRCACRSTWR